MRAITFSGLAVFDPERTRMFEPLCFAYISAYLNTYSTGVEVIERNTVDELLNDRPDIVGISASTENFDLAVEAAERIREALGVPVIVGGVHISALPYTLPPVFSAGVIGEGEETVAEIMRLFSREGALDERGLGGIRGIVFHGGEGQILRTPPRPVISPLDRVPIPHRRVNASASASEHYVLTSRGCPFRCSFCSCWKHWEGYRILSAERVVREIEVLKEEFGCDHIAVFDDLFIIDKPRLREIARLMAERGLIGEVSFRCQVRANLAERELFELLRSIGVSRVLYGAESCAPRVLRYLKGPGITPEDNQRILDLAEESGIKAEASFIRCAPIETEDELERTHSFILRNLANGKLSGFLLGDLAPYPGTEVWKYAKKRGLVSDYMDWGRFRRGGPIYLNEEMSQNTFQHHTMDFSRRLDELNYTRWTAGTIQAPLTIESEDGLAFVLDESRGKIFYRGRVLTSACALSLLVRRGGAYYNSALEQWTGKWKMNYLKGRRTLTLSSVWRRIPITLILRISLSGRKIKFIAEVKAEDDIWLDTFMINLMLIEDYRSWEAKRRGEAAAGGHFPGRFGDYGDPWVSVLDAPDCSAITLPSPAEGLPSVSMAPLGRSRGRFDILNSDCSLQSRIMQRMYEPGRRIGRGEKLYGGVVISVD